MAESPRWLMKLEMFVAMPVGVLFLAIGVGNLIVLLEMREGRWTANLFMAIFGILAGTVFFVRPLYRIVRGGKWWTPD